MLRTSAPTRIAGFVVLIAVTMAACARNDGATAVLSSSTTPGGHSSATIRIAASPAGAFAELPAISPPLSVERAIQAARAEGKGAATDAATAVVTTRVADYADFQRRLGITGGKQLGAAETVIMVTVHAAYSGVGLPRPPKATAVDWPLYSVAYDPRTGATLWLGPLPIADGP